MKYRLSYLCPDCNIEHTAILNEAQLDEATTWLIGRSAKGWKVLEDTIAILTEYDELEYIPTFVTMPEDQMKWICK